MSKTAFKKLGLEPDATEDQIKARWRELASEHHPDRGGDNDKFVEYSIAYKKCLEIARRPKPCPACGGKGEEVKMHGFKAIRTRCRFCNGTGKENKK